MEEIWNNVKPFSYPQKGINGYYNYGYSPRKRTRYYKLKRRKVYRQIKKYGFDATECWNLYSTIMRWLSDNVGGFFRECGDEDEWDKDLTTDNYKEIIELANKREESYKEHLTEHLESLEKEDEWDTFIDFVIPRLTYFENHFGSYPAKFNTGEEWHIVLKKMIEELDWNTDSTLFVEYFFNLWD